MPSTSSSSSSISLAHLNYEASSYLRNLLTLSLTPSSGSFKTGDTIDIFFPLRTLNGISVFEPTLGLCKKYNISDSSMECVDKYSIGTHDKIPCFVKTNSSIKITCRIILGNEKSFTPTIIKAQIDSGSANSIKLSFMTTTPKTSTYSVSIIMKLSGRYEGISLNTSLTSTPIMPLTGDFSIGVSSMAGGSGPVKIYYLNLSITLNVSKVWIYLGTHMHRVPNNILHDDIYSDLDILYTTPSSVSSGSITINFKDNMVP